MADPYLPLRQLLPVPAAATSDNPTQQAFRAAIEAVEDLREQLRTLRAAQAAARRAYWQQVGPLAAAAVAAHRALFEPLETALTAGYLTRLETRQVTELLWQQAHGLQTRFGEDEAERLARYAPAGTPPAPAPEVPATPATPPPAPHEQAAAEARQRRQHRAQQAREAQAQAADLAGQALLQNTKTAYRQLARLHHPDRAAQADAAAQQTQTELMQRITAAYAAQDLAALLVLLAEAPATAHPATAEADELLRRYTQALARQQAQLRQQLAAARQPTDDAPWSGTEKQQRTRLRQLKRDLRDEADYLNYLARQLQEPTALRQWLKSTGRTG